MKKSGSRKREVGSGRLSLRATLNLFQGKQSRFLILIITLSHLITCLYSQDMKVKLNSSDGSTSFQVRDSADVVVSSITSDGNVHSKYGVRAATGVFTGTGAETYSVTTSSGINMCDGLLKIGSSSSRYIYDDAVNYATRFSSNASIAGNLKVDGKIYYVYKASVTYYNASPGWLNNTSAATWGGGYTITGEDFSPTGAVLVRAGIMGMADEVSAGVSSCTAINVYESGSATYGDEWAMAILQHDNPAVAFTPWYPFTLTGTRTYYVSAFTRNSEKWYGFKKVWIEIMPRP